MYKNRLKKEGETESMTGLKGAKTGGNRRQESVKQPENDTRREAETERATERERERDRARELHAITIISIIYIWLCQTWCEIHAHPEF